MPRSRGERDRASLGSLLCWLLRGDSRRSDGSGRLRAAFSAESEASYLDEVLEGSRGERDRASFGSLLCWLFRGDFRRSDSSGRLRAAFSVASEASCSDEVLKEREELADEQDATPGSDVRSPGEEVQLSLRLTK